MIKHGLKGKERGKEKEKERVQPELKHSLHELQKTSSRNQLGLDNQKSRKNLRGSQLRYEELN